MSRPSSMFVTREIKQKLLRKFSEFFFVSPFKVVELLLLLMMESYPWLTNKNLFQCQHNNRGYCKFGDKCRYRHFTKICTNRICKLKECRFRHPRSCRNRENCKFFKRNVCLYKHIKQDYPEKYTRYEEEINQLKMEIKRLKDN